MKIKVTENPEQKTHMNKLKYENPGYHIKMKYQTEQIMFYQREIYNDLVVSDQ